MITRVDVADLRPGDVVELRFQTGTVIRGPLATPAFIGGLGIAGAGWDVRGADGSPHLPDDATLTVVSRAPRPLYVNSDRTEPVPGDLATEDTPGGRGLWFFITSSAGHLRWVTTAGRILDRDELPARLRLLVDGATGQAVTS